ncbi:GvpL/GvpF family gas vesicle protein [Amycolatopsis sp. GM8]|uniref:GvpL/GvpF family gas vesicle protein n=1 Tax=Amycolatopsis sp. GM8 TaxID=2896530 RepID=UPI001F29F59F|nr:GvpL/GvpF family gas vesicle protein [Amycolatopsis sp. GM8]
MAERQGIWLYAVTRKANPAALGDRSGVASETPRTVEAGGLVAVVGDVPLPAFGEEALHRNFEDLDWLAAVARAHDAVIGAVVAAGPAVPVRLATVYGDDDRVRTVLTDRATEFAQVLDHVAGRAEWGVKVFVTPVAESRPTAGKSSEHGAGTAYLARRRAALTQRERHDRGAAEQADRVHRTLATLAAGSRLHPPQSQVLAGNAGRMILNAAYLIDDDHAASFAQAVAACDGEHDTISVHLTGPWPPYSFSSLEQR